MSAVVRELGSRAACAAEGTDEKRGRDLSALVRREHRERLLIVMAHPDDEALWLGSLIADRDVALVHLTDGSPRDPWFAKSAGCKDDREYATLRARELDEALAVRGLGTAPRFTLGAHDREAAFDLAGLSRAFAELITVLRPSAVIAHAYDGDHDAAAFVARAATALTEPAPVLFDAAGYHAGASGLEIGFLPRPANAGARERVLSGDERTRKARALACVASQRDVIARLDTSTEHLRPAAREDFAAAPHPGRLHYEEHGWPIDGATFRGHATNAARALGIAPVLP